jgi:putative transposase
VKPEHYKYHLAIRIKGYDYSGPGIYFITICTIDRGLILSDIENSIVRLHPVGQVADSCLVTIPEHFLNSNIIEHIVMPDHVHFVIGISEKNGTACRASTESQFESFGNPVRGSIPTIIRSYKSAVSKLIHERILQSPMRIWQPGYYEHVIRNEDELKYTIDYIKSNPEEWERNHNDVS